MGDIYDEFESDLRRWREGYRDRPDLELQRLLLLALEREQLVTVAYRNELMKERIEEQDLSTDLKEAFAHSLAWAWKDEELHAIYTRGLLIRLGNFSLKVRALVQQLAGAIGGWSSSVEQHVRWSRAPMSRAIAKLVVVLGRLSGKVPLAVRRELRYLSFGEFCRMQVDAERTAALCWKRLWELSGEVPRVEERAREEFSRMWADEESHGRVFEIIASAIESGAEEGRVIEQLREAGEFFLPRAQRSGALAHHPLGSGGRVIVLQGDEELSQSEALGKVLGDVGLEASLREKARSLGKKVSELTIVVKVTFMMGYDRGHPESITHPGLIEDLARRLLDLGANEILVGDGRNLYDRFFHNRAVADVACYFGLDSPLYQIVDMTDDQVAHAYPRGTSGGTLSRSWRDADFRIVVAKMRSHPVDFTHLCLGGLEGLAGRLDSFLFFERQAHRDTALLMPLTEFPPDLAVIDGYESAADGLVGIIACPFPPAPRRLYAGRDALAVDLVASRHLGLERPRDSFILDAACHWFGDPTPRIEIVGPDEPVNGWRHPHHNELTALLSLVANPVYQFLSFRGGAFLPPMDEDAFPRKQRDGIVLRLERRAIQSLLGMRRGA
ncbi:MAG TPA: DUF362 domain-containing protein [Vicinamibacteria bacterium]|nr:DUF362 domain-containing protein [Vicinamibacteria bacterium]